MILQDIIDRLQLKVLTNPISLRDCEVSQGYISDMLSCVVAGAPNGCLWVTLLAHNNIIAVASLLDIPAIIITENAQPDQATLGLANEKGVDLLSTPKPSFEIVGQLWEMGIRGSDNTDKNS